MNIYIFHFKLFSAIIFLLCLVSDWRSLLCDFVVGSSFVGQYKKLQLDLMCFSSCSVLVACSATTSTTTTRVTAEGPSPSPSLPSVPCTSAKRAPRAKTRARLTKNWWTQPPSPLPLTPHRALTPTSTMPTTPAWRAWQPRGSVDSRARL